MPEVLCICHPEGGTAGVFEEAAAQCGVEIVNWMVADEPEPPASPDSFCGLLVLGGDQNVDEQHLYPYLTRELEFISAWLGAGRPALGVCLGAQLLAEALGGRVARAREREFGWLDVTLLPDGLEDPVTGFGAERFPALQWHDYAIEPPEGSAELASSPVCLQAYRLGEAWGVQFHPEVTGEILEEWLEPLLAGEQGAEKKAEAEGMLAEMPAHIEGWNDYGRELFTRFVGRCL